MAPVFYRLANSLKFAAKEVVNEKSWIIARVRRHGRMCHNFIWRAL
jgi:hypothetical protein